RGVAEECAADAVPDAGVAAADGTIHLTGAVARIVREWDHHQQRQPSAVYSVPTATSSGREPDSQFWVGGGYDGVHERRMVARDGFRGHEREREQFDGL